MTNWSRILYNHSLTRKLNSLKQVTKKKFSKAKKKICLACPFRLFPNPQTNKWENKREIKSSSYWYQIPWLSLHCNNFNSRQLAINRTDLIWSDLYLIPIPLPPYHLQNQKKMQMTSQFTHLIISILFGCRRKNSLAALKFIFWYRRWL